MKSKTQKSKTDKSMTSKTSIVTSIIDWAVESVAAVVDDESALRDALNENQNALQTILSSCAPAQKVSGKKVKDPNAPKRGKSSYIFFCVDNREKIKTANPDMSAKDIIKELGRVWREDVSDEDKARYAKLSEEDKLRYEEENKDYVPPANLVSEKKIKRVGPKRGLTAYIFFCKEHRAVLKEEQPDLSTKDITSELGKKWRSLSDKDKEPFVKLANKDKDRYEKDKLSWTDSPDDKPVAKSSKKTKAAAKDTKPAKTEKPSKKTKAVAKDSAKAAAKDTKPAKTEKPSKKTKEVTKDTKAVKGKSSKKDTKAVKGKTSKKTGYILFCQEERDALKEEHEDWSSQQITKELGKAWNDLTDDEKAEYDERASAGEQESV